MPDLSIEVALTYRGNRVAARRGVTEAELTGSRRRPRATVLDEMANATFQVVDDVFPPSGEQNEYRIRLAIEAPSRPIRVEPHGEIEPFPGAVTTVFAPGRVVHGSDSPVEELRRAAYEAVDAVIAKAELVKPKRKP